jgi:recombination protein RecA
MAKKKKNDKEPTTDINDFARTLTKDMNKELGAGTVFAIGDEVPTDVKSWVTSGLEVLDWICSGRANGGYPEGKLIEISGPSSIGKSHLAYQATKNVQKAGGITLYIDTESTAARETMRELGVDVDDPKVLIVPANDLESVFRTIESFVKKVASYPGDVPLCVVWDSVGGIGSVKDAQKDYEDAQQPGVAAKAIKRGLRRLRNTLGYGRILFIVINQQYSIIGADRWEDQTTTGGGAGLKYACDVRIQLKPVGGVKAIIYPDDMEHKEAMKKDIPSIGMKVKAKTIKNRLTAPSRTCEFEIHFAVGLRDHHQRWTLLNDNSPIALPDGRTVQMRNDAHKAFLVFDKDGVETDEGGGLFRKSDIRNKMDEHAKLVTECIDVIMSSKMKKSNKSIKDDPNADFDPTSYSENEALENSLKEIDDAFKDLD